MPASSNWLVLMTVAEKGDWYSGTSPKPDTPALLPLLRPVMVTVVGAVCWASAPYDRASSSAAAATAFGRRWGARCRLRLVRQGLGLEWDVIGRCHRRPCDDGRWATWARHPWRTHGPVSGCFPARGLPQSGSKGLSQSPARAAQATPLAKWQDKPASGGLCRHRKRHGPPGVGRVGRAWVVLSRRPATPRPAPCAAWGWWWCTAAARACRGRRWARRRRPPARPRGSPRG